MSSATPLNVLMISSLWPEPASSGAGLRMLELSQLFVQQGWRVTYAATAQASEYAENLDDLGIQSVGIEVNDSRFDQFVAELSPDIVLFDRFNVEEQFGWRVEQACPAAMRMVETVDLHTLREARQAAFKRQAGVILNPAKALLFSDIAKREVAAMLRSDLSILVSDDEIRMLTAQFAVDASLLHYCPFMFRADQIHHDSPPFETRQHFMTIGNFRHPPNWDAVLWLKQQIWPEIRAALPEAEMFVYGAYAPPKATALDDPRRGFRVLGRAAHVDDVMQKARICLAPLRFGAGIKTKLADAMRNGTPAVTTSVGAEGMSGDLPWCGAIADDAGAFAEAAIDLYRDQEKWKKAQNNGFSIVSSLFDAETNGNALISRINEIRSNLEEHRLNNFTGAMLRHHHHRSTEFMSRWIELKNSSGDT